MEAGAREYFNKIEERGGVLRCVETGFFQQEIANSAYRYQQAVDDKAQIIIGVNDFVIEEPISIPILRMDGAGEKRHLERLNRVRRERGQQEVAQRLRSLEQAAQGNDNLMPYILDAVRAYATLGEVCGVMRGVFGEYKAPVLV